MTTGRKLAGGDVDSHPPLPSGLTKAVTLHGERPLERKGSWRGCLGRACPLVAGAGGPGYGSRTGTVTWV